MLLYHELYHMKLGFNELLSSCPVANGGRGRHCICTAIASRSLAVFRGCRNYRNCCWDEKPFGFGMGGRWANDYLFWRSVWYREIRWFYCNLCISMGATWHCHMLLSPTHDGVRLNQVVYPNIAILAGNSHNMTINHQCGGAHFFTQSQRLIIFPSILRSRIKALASAASNFTTLVVFTFC